MKPLMWGGVVLAALALAGCGKSGAESPSAHHGRYVGIGIYEPGDLWQRMTTAAPAANASAEAARLADDEQVIVVVDSDTGEVRQCGNLSGYCVGMNPWTKALLAQAPVNLEAHNVKLPRVEVQSAPAAAPPAKAP